MGRSSRARYLSPTTHGWLDQWLACAFALAPILFAADTPRPAADACYAMVLVLWLLSVFTRYPFGYFGAIPFRAHGVIELLLAPLLLLWPWLAGFAAWPVARVVFVVAGALVLLLGLSVDFRAERRRVPPHEPPVARGAAPPHRGP